MIVHLIKKVKHQIYLPNIFIWEDVLYYTSVSNFTQSKRYTSLRNDLMTYSIDIWDDQYTVVYKNIMITINNSTGIAIFN
jgi:hypothetical protein